MIPMMPYKIITRHTWMQELSNICSWLCEHVGEQYCDWVTEWADNDRVCVKFVCEADAILFTLRWS